MVGKDYRIEWNRPICRAVADRWRVEWCGPFAPNRSMRRRRRRNDEDDGAFDPIHLGDDSAFVTPRSEGEHT